jgi:CBS domain-containing protein
MQVKELMTRDVEACRPEDTLSRAAQLMWECDCGVIPVVDEERRVVGVLTDRDICMAVYTKDQRPSAIQVGEVMTSGVECCAPDDSLAAAESTMKQRHVRRVPVVDGQNRLVGILSLNDLARHISQGNGQRRDGVAMKDVAETLAAVCTPWSELNRGDGSESSRKSALAQKNKG